MQPKCGLHVFIVSIISFLTLPWSLSRFGINVYQRSTEQLHFNATEYRTWCLQSVFETIPANYTNLVKGWLFERRWLEWSEWYRRRGRSRLGQERGDAQIV